MAHLTKLKHGQIKSPAFFEQFYAVPDVTDNVPKDPIDMFMAAGLPHKKITNIAQEHDDIWRYYLMLVKNYRPIYMRNDITTVCCWRFNAPDNVTDQNSMNYYFILAFAFCKMLYGIESYENILGCWIHDDGQKSYMQFLFCPVFVDEETGKKQLNCSKIIDRQHLRTFHPKFYDFCEANGFSVKEGKLKNVEKD